MTNKYIFTILSILIVTQTKLCAWQNPGVLGRHFAVSIESSINYGSFISKLPLTDVKFSLEGAISRSLSVKAGYQISNMDFKLSNDLYFVNDYKDINCYATGTANVNIQTFNLSILNYFYKRGAIAPYGFYWGVDYYTSRISPVSSSFYETEKKRGLPYTTTVKQEQTIDNVNMTMLGLQIGRKRPLFGNRFIYQYSLSSALEISNTSNQYYANSGYSGSENTIQSYAKDRICTEYGFRYLGRINFGLSYLF